MGTIAELLVKIGGDNAGLKKTLADSEASVKSAFSADPIHAFTGALSGATDGIGSMVGKLSGLAALAAGGFGLGALVDGAVKAGENIYQLSTRLGISTSEAGELSRILRLTGGDTETFASAISRLDKNFMASGAAGEKVRTILDAFGVSLTDGNGKLLPLNQQLANLAQGYQLATAAGLKQEFVLETLGIRGLSLVKTLQDYNGAAEKAKNFKGIGLDPQQMHELKQELDLVSMQASQIGLAFTGAFAPVAEQLFPPIMEGLQKTAVFLAENKIGVIELTKDMLELAVAYKGIHLLASAGNAMANFWQRAAVEAAASASLQTAATEGLTLAQERSITRALAASEKMYAKMQADAVKTARAAGLSAEETAAVIAEQCVRIAEESAVAAASIRENMTSAFLAQARAAQVAAAQVSVAFAEEGAAATVAGGKMVAASEMAATSARVATVAQAEMTAATVASGEAAVLTGEKTVSAMGTAKVAAGNFLSGLWALAGGWIGVAVATGFAIMKLVEYMDGLNKVKSYNPEAEVYDDPDRPGMHLKKQWVEHTPTDEEIFASGVTAGDAVQLAIGGGYERVPLSEAEEEEHGAYTAWVEKQKANKPWLQNGEGLDPDLLAKLQSAFAGNGDGGGSTGNGSSSGGSSAADHAAERAAERAERATERAKQLMADLNKEISGDSGTVYQAGMDKVVAAVTRYKDEIQKIEADGGDTTGLRDKVAEYQVSAAQKVTDAWRKAWTDLKSDTAIASAELLQDKKAQADAEYQLELEKIAKEKDARFKEIAQDGNDTVAKEAVQTWADTKTAQAAQKRDYAKDDAALQQYKDALQYDGLRRNLEGQTQAQIDAIRQQDLKNYIAALEEKIVAAKDNKERQLQLQNDLNDALNQKYQLDATDRVKAADVAMQEIKNRQTNYAQLYTETYDNIYNSFTDNIEKMLEGTEGLSKGIRSIIYSMCKEIEQLFVKTFVSQAISAPLQNLFQKVLPQSGNTGKTAASMTTSSIGGWDKLLTGFLPTASTASSAYSFNWSGFGDLLGFASGGDNPGGWSIVGENGPELAYFGDPAHIYTATDTSKILNSAMTSNQSGKAEAGHTIVFNVSTPNASSFRQSQGQMYADASRLLQLGRRNV